eukprot:TRINITY_DN8445_c1_g2_i2.p1 TRINITY_DN8445_c1_g2~~TRINITY_DN8445_c1_g2_i2.p1  ORF type:complete len:296 (-),score=38.46 TRINITY_DN8445_c1_g2_i2:152-1039(-)
MYIRQFCFANSVKFFGEKQGFTRKMITRQQLKRNIASAQNTSNSDSVEKKKVGQKRRKKDKNTTIKEVPMQTTKQIDSTNLVNSNQNIEANKIRCDWAAQYSGANSQSYFDYHDNEWGRPIYDDDRALFELLNLEGAQSGLSWAIILNKRENYRKQFDNFQIEKVAKYDEQKVVELLAPESGIVRNKQKVAATIQNAKAVLEVQKEFGSFSEYVWSFMPDQKPVNNKWKKLSDLPSKTELSEKMSKDMKKRGFKFVGPTTCYSFMQGAGLVNDHVQDCFCYKEIVLLQKSSKKDG